MFVFNRISDDVSLPFEAYNLYHLLFDEPSAIPPNDGQNLPCVQLPFAVASKNTPFVPFDSFHQLKLVPPS